MLTFIEIAGALLAVAFVGQRWAEARDRRRYPAPGRLIDVEGVMLHVVVQGSGPLVLFDSGLGGGSDGWQYVADDLATTCTVVTYDRPGFGWSPAHRGDRSPKVVADRIAGLLQALELGPAVLVGHSLGGLHVRLAASLHPEVVAGLVLVDPSHEDMLNGEVPPSARIVEHVLRSFALLSPFGVARVGGRVYGRVVAGQARRAPDADSQAMAKRATALTLCTVRGLRSVVAELASLPAALDETRSITAAHPLPAIPITVISAAGEPRSEAEREAQQTMRALHDKSASQSPLGKHVTADRSGHLVMLDQPELIAACVRDVIGVRS